MKLNVPSRSPYIDYKLLAEHIRKYRKLRSLTQAELAIKLGYKNETNYGKVERGSRPISLKQLAHICVILQVRLEDMLEGCLIHDEWPIDAEDPSNSDDVGEVFRDLLKGQSDKTIALAYALCTSLVKEMSKE